jgi:hypothetical protein
LLPAAGLAVPLVPAEVLLPPVLLEPPPPSDVSSLGEQPESPLLRATQNIKPAKLRIGCGIVIGSWLFTLSGPSASESDQTPQ